MCSKLGQQLMHCFNAHCKVWGPSTVSCAKTAERIEMQFGMLSQVGPGNMYYIGMQMTPWEGALLGLSG